MKLKRKFILGEEWLYLKIYSGPKILEQILVQKLQKPIRKFIQGRWISHFFFIRYSDPDFHIRLRMRLTESQNLAPIIYELNQELTFLVPDRIIYKVSYDTYNREMERYGNAIEIAERIFYADSLSTIHYLLQTGLSDEHRWLYSMSWIDALLDSFQFSDEGKSKFYQKMYYSYSNEFGIQKPARVVMDKKYRKLGKKMEAVFYGKEQSDQSKLIVNEVDVFSKSSHSLVKEIVEMQAAEILNVRLESLISSIIHMHINRMFRTQQRKYELLIYHFLAKFHTSRLARKTHMKKKAVQKSNV